MLVSDRYRCIFVHVQKTAGSSFRSALSLQDPDVYELGGKHAGISELENLPAGYFRFAFVRNPWERLVSWHQMILEKGRNRKFENINSRFYRMVLSRGKTFRDFILDCTEEVNENGSIKSIVRNQTEYLLARDGTLGVDYTGRYEALDDDQGAIARRLGVDMEMPHIKQSGDYGSWRQYYTDELAGIVEERFQLDIETFGYRFE